MMPRFALPIYLPLLLVGTSLAQQPAPAVSGTVATEHAMEMYYVHLAEYQRDGLTNPAQSAAEIVALLTQNGGQQNNPPVETIRLSVMSGAKCMAQFGKRVAVTVGSVTNRGSTSRQTQFMETGTQVLLTATPKSGKIVVELSYESSRLDGEGTDDGPPGEVTTQIETTQLVEFDKPMLVGGTTAGDSSYVLLTVTR